MGLLDIAAFNAARRTGSPEADPLSINTEICVHASTAIPVAFDDAGAPLREIQLLPMGRIEARDGRGPWLLKDRAHAEAVIAASRAYAGKADILVDFDHQSIFGAKPGVGGRAPASGWISPDSLEVRDDGIWAAVAWTEDAQADLKAKRYRYVSPYFGMAKGTGLVTRIFNAALTNTPAIVEIAAAASVSTPEGTPPLMLKVLALLGLDESATEDAACASVTALLASAKAGEQLAAAASALGLAADASGEEVVAAAALAAANKPDPSKFAPIASLTALSDRLAVIDEERATAAVAAATAAGKITPDPESQAWALDYFAKDEAGFAAFVQRQPAVLDNTKGPAGRKPEAEQTELSSEERQACAALNISEADFLAERKSEKAQ